MLTSAIKFKDVFPRYAERDLSYIYHPTNKGQENVQKLILNLKVFKSATAIMLISAFIFLI